MESSQPGSHDRQWYIAERWQQYEAEGRANLLRIVGVGAFYTVHLLHYYASLGKLPQLGFLQLGGAESVDRQFHVAVTLLAVAWTMLALGLLLCLQRQIFPAWLKYFSTGCDVVLLTSILTLADGPRSALVVGYFVILALATLRISLPLVRFATIGCLVGYLCLLGCAKWPASFGKGAIDISVPRYQQLIVLIAIALTGIILGQVVRRVRHMADDFAQRVGGAGE